MNGSVLPKSTGLWTCKVWKVTGPESLGPWKVWIRPVQTAWRNSPLLSLKFRLPGGLSQYKQHQWNFRTCDLWSLSQLLRTTCVFMFSPAGKEDVSSPVKYFRNYWVCCAPFSCHGTADCDMNYLNWTNWLLHSSSRSLCGHSLDVHCRLERINRKT